MSFADATRLGAAAAANVAAATATAAAVAWPTPLCLMPLALMLLSLRVLASPFVSVRSMPLALFPPGTPTVGSFSGSIDLAIQTRAAIRPYTAAGAQLHEVVGQAAHR